MLTTRCPGFSSTLQVVAEELDRVGPLDARERLLDVVADQLREVEVDRREMP